MLTVSLCNYVAPAGEGGCRGAGDGPVAVVDVGAVLLPL